MKQPSFGCWACLDHLLQIARFEALNMLARILIAGASYKRPDVDDESA